MTNHAAIKYPSTSQFLGWMNRDSIKEESDVLAASGLTMNEVGRHISNAAKQFYLGKLKGV